VLLVRPNTVNTYPQMPGIDLKHHKANPDKASPALPLTKIHSFCVLMLMCPPSTAPEVGVLHPSPFLTSAFLCRPPLISAPCKVTFPPCSDVSFLCGLQRWVPFTGSHPSHVLTYPPSAGPACGGLARLHSFFPNQHALACPFSMVAQCIDPMPGPAMWWPFAHLLPLLCHTLWAPMPWVLRWWLYQPHQQTQHWKRPGPWQVQCPPMAGSAPSSVYINA